MRELNRITFTPKRFFPGGNTARGFVSRFSGIVPPWSGEHYCYIIKGGPGVGKSTLMKRISQKALELGFMTEEFYCSGDPDSLDALRIPGRSVVLLDGTSPHAMDPQLPGAGQEIVNLGIFKDRELLREKRSEIGRLTQENSRCYKVAYSLLSAAGELKKAAREAVAERLDPKLLQSCAADFMGAFAGSEATEPRRLFISAITHKGPVDFAHDGPWEDLVISVGELVGSVFLQEAEKLLWGRRAEIYCDPLLPEFSEGLRLPGARLSFALCPEEDSDLNSRELMSSAPPDFVAFHLSECEKLVSKAMEQLKICKEIHDELENIYRCHVDFPQVDALSRRLEERIFPGE